MGRKPTTRLASVVPQPPTSTRTSPQNLHYLAPQLQRHTTSPKWPLRSGCAPTCQSIHSAPITRRVNTQQNLPTTSQPDIWHEKKYENLSTKGRQKVQSCPPPSTTSVHDFANCFSTQFITSMLKRVGISCPVFAITIPVASK